MANSSSTQILARTFILSLLGLWGCMLPVPSLAWGTQGHQVVALMAQAQLSPYAQKEVDRLLTLEPEATLASIATWADVHHNRTTARWHFVNFPRDSCQFERARDCADGQCVIHAIEHELQTLASDAPDAQRLLALKYLVHLVADIHQPLHGGYLDDKGGNTYPLQVFMRSTNLHALWDSGLLRSLNEAPQTMARRLLAGKPNTQSQDLNMVHAAEESCQVVRQPGFYPNQKIDVNYLTRFTPVLDQRLTLAGTRLAGLLNQVLQPR